MRWKDLSIGKKLGVGFGSVLFLLTGIAIYTYFGFNKVDHLAHETEEMSSGNQFVLLKTIDHLNWVSSLSTLVFKDDVHSINIQTDDTKCGFGKWLYGEETKKLAAENKEIGALLENIKEPHKRLHHTAIKIQETYVPFNRALDGILADRWIDHLVWIKKLSQSIMTETEFTGGLDPKACAFGKWYHSYKPMNQKFAALLKGWEEPHARLHGSAEKIVSYLDRGDMEGAMRIYQDETISALGLLEEKFEDTMGWIDASSEKVGETQGIFNNETLLALADTKKILDEIRESYQNEYVRMDEEMMTGIDSAILYNLIFSVCAVVIGILASLLIAKGITGPIAKGVEFARIMSNGDLTKKLDIHQKDEIGILANALNSMAQNLRGMFQDINGGVETISSSSTELSAISQQMAAGAEQTSGKSNQVASAAEEMSANMNSVAAASEQASTNIQMVAAASEEMSATINEISGNTEKGRVITGEAVTLAQTVSGRVGELGKAASDVGKVTETINDISEQTNLLALNATIEAARAGEAGKGFAVVANEIKELAKQTAEATQDIRFKLEGIQGSTEGTVVEINKIEKVIADINDIVCTIATAIEEQSASTKEIAGNVNQAAQGIQDVNENVAQSSTVAATIAEDVVEVNQAANEMADGSGQVNASAEELSRLSESLKQMVEQFKI
ncbi:methyl-accepting chemotaxis protein [Desulfopila sp. IMCC35008]|uniref:methyl-accepting chemotaxis protein n=1 Tax=Desulfopila sp. IMCC35008 TaxID=2653858 RepID=UPI0013D4C048|nr:methyl-accepting chemotaxis protein [Desulfopila sp. IMCC35008]